MGDILAGQPTFRPPLPIVYGCKDHREQRDLLIRIDEIFNMVGADWRFVRLSLDQYDLWLQESSDAEPAVDKEASLKIEIGKLLPFPLVLTGTQLNVCLHSRPIAINCR